MIIIAFGSDCLTISGLGFPLNTPISNCIITYALGISIPETSFSKSPGIDCTDAISSTNFAA